MGGEQHSLEQGATLIPQLAWSAFAGRDFSHFQTVVQQAHKELATAKLQPLGSQLSSPYLYGRSEPKPCAAYEHLPAEAGGVLSKQAQRDRALGTDLPRVQALTFTSAGDSDHAFGFPNSSVKLGEARGEVLRNTFDFTPSATAWEVKPLLGQLPTVREAMRAKSCDLTAYRTWLSERGLDAAEDEVEPRAADERDPLTFGELAALSEGATLLGALMLDADRMGEVFARGMPRAGPSQVAALSRMIETFFAAEVGQLIRKPETYADMLGYGDQDRWKAAEYPLIYSVYAGGDDLFLLGPWHVLLAFALDLNRLYARYTAHPAFSLSGGFALVRPPIVQVSQQLHELEQRAKAANQSALASGQPTGHLALFGQVVPWPQLTELTRWVDKLVDDLRKGRVSRAQTYRWLKLYSQYQETKDEDPALAMRYKPLLSYALRPQGESSRQLFTDYQDLLNHEHPAWRYLSVWVQWGLYKLRER